MSAALLAAGVAAVPASAGPSDPGDASTGPGSTQPVCAAPAKAEAMRCFAIRRVTPGTTRGVAPAASIIGYGPSDLASAYNLPATGGDGTTVAIVDAYDDPTAEADLAIYRQQWGLPACTSDNGCFRKIDQHGGTHYPTPDANWSGEISLDLDAVSATCPACHILLVEADSNSIDDLGAAVDQAVASGAKVVSNSYGGPEDAQMIAAEEPHFTHPGVAITVSSGDDGYGVSYPASSPYVTSVGGTSLNRDESTPRGWAETVWRNYTGAPGSGCSAVESKPFFQHDSGCAKRAVADVSAVADPITGLAVYQTYGGNGWTEIGGTSLSSPVIAGIYALAGPVPAGDSPNWYPYAATSGLHDVTSGSNGTCDPAYLCTAGTGYDGPTGLGTPDGVAAFRSPGPHGHVAGTVTDSASGQPIAQASVSVTGTDGDATAITDASGRYDVTEAVGDHQVSVTAFGHVAQSRQVTVTDGRSSAGDFALTPQPLVTLSGRVSDASGHGWPLYAKVTAPGTPLPAVYTDPSTGRYSMRVPAHSAFSLHVQVEHIAGYDTADGAVSVDAADVARNLGVPVDQETCTAPGYEHRYAGLPAEPFESTSVPAGWSVDNETANGGWEFDKGTVIPRTNQTIGSGNFALVDTQLQEHKTTTLTTPPVDLTGVSDPVVGFRNYYVGAVPVQSGYVEVSIDGGATWSTLWEQHGPQVISGPLALPIPQAAGKSGVLVRFRYDSQYGRYWELDDVYVGTRSCSPVPGGLLTGQVLDANSGDGVDGATVAGSGGQTTSVATPDDDSLGDGYYAVFAPTSGQFTASAPNRVSSTRSVDITPDAVTRTDFSLAAGQLSITPGSVSKAVTLGGTAKATIKVTNSGTAPAQVHLVEQPGGFGPMSRSVDATPVQRSVVPVSWARRAAARTPAVRVTPAAGSADSAWAPVADDPGGPIMDDAMARGDDGQVYVVGGTPDGYGASAKAYVYDPTRLLWSPIADLPVPVQQPAATFLNGKLIVAGGWGSTDAVADVQIYDPATNTWSAGTAMPGPRAAAGSAVLGGKLYVVGGCDVGDCMPGVSTVFVYDPVRDRWSTAADYPAGEMFLACGGVDGAVVCAGGLDVATGNGSAATYAYNPTADAWTRRADLPTGWWGAASTAANGELLMSGGVSGAAATSSAVTNEGYAYDAAANTWQQLPNAPAPFYRGAAACGVFRVGGATDHFNATAVAAQLPGYDLCGPSGTVPWLSESADSFTLQPGASKTVTLSLDASDPAVVDQPGDYTAQLAVRVDGPRQPAPATVTMHVDPPKTWGKLAGTVYGADCSGTITRLDRATVTVQTHNSTVTLWTDDGGNWSVWLDKRDNPVTLAVSKDRFTTALRTMKVNPKQVTTEDVVLQPAHC